MLVVTLGNAGPKGKHMSLEKVRSSLLNEEAYQKNEESITDPKALATEGDLNKGRSWNRSPKIGTSLNQGRSRRGGPHASIARS